MHNKKWAGIILALVILIFELWPSLIPGLPGKWIVILAAIILLVGALTQPRRVIAQVPATVSRRKRR